jgi:hypothetical protein
MSNAPRSPNCEYVTSTPTFQPASASHIATAATSDACPSSRRRSRAPARH